MLCDLVLPDRTLRLWDGSSGPFIDGNGSLYRSAQFTEDALQSVEAAINGEAFTMQLALTNIPTSVGDSVWDYDEDVSVAGAPFILKLQELNDFGQPVGEPEIKFTGTIDNIEVLDQSEDESSTSIVMIDVVNAFTLRNTTHGGVLSDVDQKARSARLNPSAAPDRFCERIPGLRDRTIRWPRW